MDADLDGRLRHAREVRGLGHRKPLDLHVPERQRLPIVHVKIEGLSVAETASLTGMSESAVKVGIHRGLKALAARFGHNWSAAA